MLFLYWCECCVVIFDLLVCLVNVYVGYLLCCYDCVVVWFFVGYGLLVFVLYCYLMWLLFLLCWWSSCEFF